MTTLHEDIQSDIRTAYAALAANSEGFAPRRQQREMIGAIASHIGVQNYNGANRPKAFQTPVIVVEAGTGTGKTYGYSMPLIVLAKHLKKKLIISTGTVALQEQVCAKDLPDLQKRSELQFNFVLAKGRRRYVCPSRLEEKAGCHSSQGTLLDASDTPTNLEQITAIHRDFDRRAWNGERDTLPRAVDEDTWVSISTDRHGCMGFQCSHIGNCPFFKAREAMENADVIVVNHDLLLSDASLGGGIVLPDPKECLLAIDEGHHLSDKVLSRSGANHWIQGSREWLTKVDKTLKTTHNTLPSDLRRKADANGGTECAERVSAALLRLGFSLPENSELQLDPKTNEANWRFKSGKPPSKIVTFGEEILPEAKALLAILDKSNDAVREAVKNGGITEAQGESLLPDLGFLLSRTENLVDSWSLMLSKDRNGEPPKARWVTAKHKSGTGVDYLIAASPIDAGDNLNKWIWNAFSGVVVTSATLTALGKFDYFLDKCGLNEQPKVKTLQLNSPFDYQNNGTLETPALFKSDPKNTEAHTQEILAWIEQGGVDHEGATLMLFSSYSQLRAVRDGLPKQLRSIALVQGDLPKGEVIAQHKAAVDAGKGSLIMGVDSMGEGIDLPGNYCTHVVIAKLPFSVPSHPVEEAIAEWVESQGRNTFMEITVPATSTKLIQRVGRLIRTETDTGKVSILDNRVRTKRYGRQLLDALPPLMRV